MKKLFQPSIKFSIFRASVPFGKCIRCYNQFWPEIFVSIFHVDYVSTGVFSIQSLFCKKNKHKYYWKLISSLLTSLIYNNLSYCHKTISFHQLLNFPHPKVYYWHLGCIRYNNISYAFFQYYNFYSFCKNAVNYAQKISIQSLKYLWLAIIICISNFCIQYQLFSNYELFTILRTKILCISLIY